MNYKITIQKLATGEHKNISRSLTDEDFEKWRERMNKTENGYVIIEIEMDTNLNY